MNAKKFAFPFFLCIILSSFFIWKIFFNINQKRVKHTDVSPSKLLAKTDAQYVKFARKLQKEGKTNDAITCYKKALEINPNNSVAHFDLGILYFDREAYDLAEKRLQTAAKLNPSSASLFYMIGNVQGEQGKMYEAIDSYMKAIKLRPDYIGARRKLSYAYRAIGEFQKAWKARNVATKISIAVGKTKKIRKEWDGSNLHGKTMLIRDEVGLGEMFCWIRYAKRFKDEGARVVVEARQPLIPLLKLCPYVDEIVLKGSKVPKFDDQSFVSSLIRLSNETLDDVPSEIPYLYADQTLVKKWKEKFSGDKTFKIGICWQSQIYKNRNGKILKNKRSMPLSVFYPLHTLKNVTLYSLQKMLGTDQLKNIPNDFVIHEFGKDFDDSSGRFMDTAAVMKHLDLVLTVDTSIAHLAGALGVDVWMMVPFVADWRWLLDRSDSPLYPTMSIFRQPKAGDWESVMQNVVDAMIKKSDKVS